MKTITPSEFLNRYRKGETVIIDVRSPDEYAYKHIPQSLNIPTEELAGRLKEIPRDRDVAIICQSGIRSSEACRKLEQMGLSRLTTLEGGIAAFEKEGGPVEQVRQTIPLMRQVQIAAGSLVLLGILLSQWVHPAFLLLSAFVGAGLIFAGMTGFCGMALLLAKMPWNRQNSTGANPSC